MGRVFFIIRRLYNGIYLSIDYELYSSEELAIIINFLDIVECYTEGVELNRYKNEYKKFKSIVKAKSEENNILKNSRMLQLW